MEKLSQKINFYMIFEIVMANPGGDPNNKNKPREIGKDKLGLISQESIKRLIRDEIDYLYKGSILLVRRDCDPKHNIKDRFYSNKEIQKALKEDNLEKIIQTTCENWYDARTFGEVFTEETPKDKDKDEKIKRVDSFHITGPVTMFDAISFAPIETVDIGITASFNRNSHGMMPEPGSIGGERTVVNHGLYGFFGSINLRDAERTGFSDEDAEILINALRNLFTEKSSAAKPEGSRIVRKLIIWRQPRIYSVSPDELRESVHVSLKEGVSKPSKYSDYEIEIDDLGVETEIYP